MVLCGGPSTHSWVSASLASRLKLVGEPVYLSISNFNAVKVIKTQRVKIIVSSEPNSADLSFIMEDYVKDKVNIGTECINIPMFQAKQPQLAPMKPLQFYHEKIEDILKQDYYQSVHPIELFLRED